MLVRNCALFLGSLLSQIIWRHTRSTLNKIFQKPSFSKLNKVSRKLSAFWNVDVRIRTYSLSLYLSIYIYIYIYIILHKKGWAFSSLLKSVAKEGCNHYQKRHENLISNNCMFHFICQIRQYIFYFPHSFPFSTCSRFVQLVIHI